MDCKTKKASQLRLAFRGSPNWARTSDIMINSHALYRLSYGGIYEPCIKKIQGDVGITYFSGRLPSHSTPSVPRITTIQ